MTWQARMDRGAEAARRELGFERAARVEVCGRLRDIGFDLEDVRERLVVRGALRRGESRSAQELIGVRERHSARAGTAKRTEVARADDDAVGGERARRRGLRERAREPALLQVEIARRRRVPDLDRAEVRKVRFRVADALQDRELSGFPERQQRRERRMQARAKRQSHHRVAVDCELGAKRVVARIVERHYGVEAVVAAFELDQHEQVAVARDRRRGSESDSRRPDVGDAEGRQRERGFEKAAAIHRARCHFS